MKTKTNKMKKLSYVFIAAAGIMLFACNETQTDNRIQSDREVSDVKDINDERADSAVTEDNGIFGKSDADYIVEAGANSMAAIDAAKLAADKASSTQVKEFAATVAKEQEAMHKELKALATAKNIQMPAVVEGQERKNLTDLREKTGNDFDREFMNMIVGLQNEDVNRLEKMLSNSDDSEIRTFATNHISKIKTHLEQAKAIKENVKDMK